MSNKTNIHGNMLVINGQGVLITGNPKIGKTDLSLTLVDRGHSLVSDDVTDICKKDQRLLASSPEKIQGKLLVFEIGLIDISQLYPAAILSQHQLDLVITLIESPVSHPNMTPLAPKLSTLNILGVPIPSFSLATNSTRNIPLLIETLVRYYHPYK